MSIHKRTPTKDGRCYSFYVRYKDLYGKTKMYTSGKFKTRKEAELEQAKFKIAIANKKVNISSITFNEVFSQFIKDK